MNRFIDRVVYDQRMRCEPCRQSIGAELPSADALEEGRHGNASGEDRSGENGREGGGRGRESRGKQKKNPDKTNLLGAMTV